MCSRSNWNRQIQGAVLIKINRVNEVRIDARAIKCGRSKVALSIAFEHSYAVLRIIADCQVGFAIAIEVLATIPSGVLTDMDF